MGSIVVVHSCSSFSLYCHMLPLQHAKFYIVDFRIFSAHICTVFWTLCINGEGCFLCVNVPLVAACPAGIVLQLRHCFHF